MRTLALACLAILGASVLSNPAFAQQKTVKACEQEWRANKAANQAKGITEKAYVAQCRAGTAAGAPPAATVPAASTQPNPKSSAAPTSPSRAARPATPTAPATTATGADQFSTESQAKGRCGTDTVVWVNLDSKIYHFAGHKSYGHTKSGAYMCERGAVGQGMRAAKNEKHP
jgi:hypothetical protein